MQSAFLAQLLLAECIGTLCDGYQNHFAEREVGIDCYASTENITSNRAILPYMLSKLVKYLTLNRNNSNN
jgi:hypothetical protein